MSNEIESVVERLVVVVARHPMVRAIGLSGGERPLPQPGEGDIDLFVYCTEVPALPERQASLAPLHAEIEALEMSRIERGHWGTGDSFSLAGIETWLLYFTLAESRAELDAILAGQYLDRLDSYYYPLGRCAMWKAMRALYDPDGFLQSLKACLAEYPAGLAQAVLRHHVQALDDVEDLERAVQRKDVLFFHFALDLALDHFLQAVFALNREYFPSRKRSEAYLQGFGRKPVNCAQRLRQVVALGSSAETLDLSYNSWRDLVYDLKALTEKGE